MFSHQALFSHHSRGRLFWFMKLIQALTLCNVVSHRFSRGVFIKVMQVFFVMDSTSDLFDLCPLAYYFLSLCSVRHTLGQGHHQV